MASPLVSPAEIHREGHQLPGTLSVGLRALRVSVVQSGLSVGGAMERLFPDFQVMDPGAIYQDLVFPESGLDRPYTAINMVTTVDGKATLGARAQLIGSRVDHGVMRLLRTAADGLLIGAETLRKENVNPSVPPELSARRVARGMAPHPAAVVVTGSADLPLGGTFFRSTLFQRVVVTTERAPAEKVAAVETHARVVRAGVETVDLRLMMRILSEELGIRRLVVEGGPSLNAALIEGGMVDELFWTVAPKILGGAAARTMVEGVALPPDRVPLLQLVSVHHHESELFLRYRFPRASS